jgi:hypothetical protein
MSVAACFSKDRPWHGLAISVRDITRARAGGCGGQCHKAVRAAHRLVRPGREFFLTGIGLVEISRAGRSQSPNQARVDEKSLKSLEVSGTEHFLEFSWSNPQIGLGVASNAVHFGPVAIET